MEITRGIRSSQTSSSREKTPGGPGIYPILRLHERYTTDQIGGALKQAEDLGCLGADEVQKLLLKSGERPTTRKECSLNLDDTLASLRVDAAGLQRFNALMEVPA